MMGEKKKSRLTHSLAAKTAAFAVAVLAFCIAALSVVGVVTMFTAEVYGSSREANKYSLYSKVAYNDCYNLMRLLSATDYSEYGADELVKYSNIAKIVSESENPAYRGFSRSFGEVDERFVYTFYWYIEYDAAGNVALFRSLGNSFSRDEYPAESVYSVTLGVASELSETDDYFWYGLLIDVLYNFRFSVYPIGIISFAPE